MIPKDYEYISGSAARKLEYDVYRENKVLKAKKRYKSNRTAKLKLVLSVLAVLVAVVPATAQTGLRRQLLDNGGFDSRIPGTSLCKTPSRLTAGTTA